VKYAQCMQIWLFLKCELFLNSCVQFLNSDGHYTESSNYSDEEKGDARSVRASCIGGKGRRANETCISYLSKGRRVLWRHVSLLLNM
jgi:hypothetical protein